MPHCVPAGRAAQGQTYSVACVWIYVKSLAKSFGVMPTDCLRLRPL